MDELQHNILVFSVSALWTIDIMHWSAVPGLMHLRVEDGELAIVFDGRKTLEALQAIKKLMRSEVARTVEGL